MNLNLEKLSFGHRVMRFFLGHRTIYDPTPSHLRKKGKKLNKAQLVVDITIWNIVEQTEDFSFDESNYLVSEHQLSFGNLNVFIKDGLRIIRRVEMDKCGRIDISKATAALILMNVQKFHAEKNIKDEEEHLNKIKQSIHEGFIESKGL